MTTIIEALQAYIDGHLNETVERRNFRCRKQQAGETFNDYLISLRDLAKTCRFCSDSCIEKNIWDQLIEGISDSDTVEDLLQENNLNLTRAIAICCSKEAAKRHRFDITRESKVVAALRYPYQPARQASPMCPGCGAAVHKGGRRQCPVYNQVCAYCRKVGHYAKVCRSKQAQPPPHNSENQPSARAISVQSQQLSQQQHLQL